jgi:hypothetical protein
MEPMDFTYTSVLFLEMVLNPGAFHVESRWIPNHVSTGIALCCKHNCLESPVKIL